MCLVWTAKSSDYFRSEKVKMACQEIYSFILKFKNLMSAGKKASLNIKVNAGKAHMYLSV